MDETFKLNPRKIRKNLPDVDKYWCGFNLPHNHFDIFGADLIWRSFNFFEFGADLIWR